MSNFTDNRRACGQEIVRTALLLLMIVLIGYKSTAQTAQTLTAKEDSSLRAFLVDDFRHLPAEDRADIRYSARTVDLNGDGKPELLVYLTSPTICGSGGCSLIILEPSDSSYRLITRTTITRLPIQILVSTSHGWHDIAVFVAGEGIRPGYMAELSFNGRRYPGNPTVLPVRRLPENATGDVAIPERDAGISLYP